MSLYEKLFPYQRKIVDEIKDKKRYGLFLDMGLGKTVLALALAEINLCTKVIVVSINSKAEEDEDLRGSWLWWSKQSSINYNRWTKKIFKPTKKNPNTFSQDTNDIVLLNFESLYSRAKDVRGFTIKKELKDFLLASKGHNIAIIIDESHKLKNENSSQTKAVKQILNCAQIYCKNVNLYLATGTPFTKGFIDLYSQLKLLGWDGTKGFFKEAFCELGNIKSLPGWQQPIVGYKNVDELYKLVHKFSITIKSEEVIELPRKIFVDHTEAMSLDFLFLMRKRMRMELLNERLSKQGLPQIINPMIYNRKYSIENKQKYWSQFNVELINDEWIMCGAIKMGDRNDTFEELIEIFTEIYKIKDQYEELIFLRKFWYLFEEKHTDKGETIINYHSFKPSKLINNPFYGNLMFPDYTWLAETAATMWMRARQISIGFQGNADGYVWFDYARLNQLKNFLEDYEDNYIIFYNYAPEFFEIEKICRELGYNVDIYNGTFKNTKYYEAYENQTEAERLINTKNVIISNYASGSTGKNWQAYSKCILFSTPTYSNYEQGIKRTNRPGQKFDCIYHKFYQDNLIEQSMLERLANNCEYTEDMFNDDLKRLNEIFDRQEEEGN